MLNTFLPCSFFPTFDQLVPLLVSSNNRTRYWQGVCRAALKRARLSIVPVVSAALLITNLFGHWVSFDQDVLEADSTPTSNPRMLLGFRL